MSQLLAEHNWFSSRSEQVKAHAIPIQSNLVRADEIGLILFIFITTQSYQSIRVIRETVGERAQGVMVIPIYRRWPPIYLVEGDFSNTDSRILTVRESYSGLCVVPGHSR